MTKDKLSYSTLLTAGLSLALLLSCASLPPSAGRTSTAVSQNSLSPSSALDVDVITAIDGKSAQTYKLHQLRRMFKQEGREHVLSVMRDGQSREVKLKLRRLI